ncbi:F-box only protein 40-like [Lytechinus variegatus]|uniref:F-box only protein 40-like n=1 Tax=Lytechinus variegatus TaxID=7654 RepID=UPI001BB20B47|nr:F-box only protein 40-like [Lytechinus variegatus]
MVVEVEPDLPHSHCDSCYNRDCQVSPQPGNACSLINCEVDCGARFHRCKEEEHRLLCPYTKTECVNAIYGCPVEIQRRHICRHLEVCPASVVNCTMEWNRWPVYASERQPQQPLQVVPDNYNQLDIALALRDQRMLTKSMKASKRTRQILTNALNRRHPAVPLSAQLTNDVPDSEEEQRELVNLLQVMQDEKEAADRQRARTPPGLQRSICNELYRKNHESNGTVAEPTFQEQLPVPKDPFIHCSHCARRRERLDRVIASKAAIHDPYNYDLDEEDDPSVGDYAMTPLPEHQNGFIQEGDGCPNGLDHREGREDGVFHEGPPEADRSLNSTFSSEESEVQTPAVFVTQSTTGDVSAAPTRGHSKPIIIQPPALSSSTNKIHRLSSSSNGSLDSKQSLSLDLSLESITRYQAKPDSMYTFLCAQEFRRDEYPYHFQNVHSDIHGGLNGWMEQRCPLAPYGCTYSQRRLYPGTQGAHIIHSENLESFGLCLEESQREKTEVSGSCADTSLSGNPDGRTGDGDAQEGEDQGEHYKYPKLDAEVTSKSSGCKDMGSEHGDDERTNCDVHVTDSNNDSLHKNSTESKCNAFQDGINDKPKDVSMDSEFCIDRGSSEEYVSEISSMDQSGDTDREASKEFKGRQREKSSTEDSPKEALEVDMTSGGKVDYTEAVSKDIGTDYLSQLPFELLRYLLRFLDCFTINHLAMASKLLRQVCCSLLEERGMVVLQWEKHKGHWDTTMKVWHFSTAFTPVKSWGFQDNPPIAEHLKRCPYNVRNTATQPVRVMGHDVPKIKLESANDPQRQREAESVQAWRPRRRRLLDQDDDW